MRDRSPKRLFLLLLLILLIPPLTACGQRGGGGEAAGGMAADAAGRAAAPGSPAGPAAGRPPAALPDACLLLPPADVEAITKDVAGSLSSTLEDAVGKDPGQCSYPLAPPASGAQPRLISLTVRREASAAAAARRQEEATAGLRSLGAGAPVEAVAQVGDGALWVGGQLDQLHFRRGDTLLILTVQIDRQPLATARALAARILARLAAPAPAAAPASQVAAPPSGTSKAPAAPAPPAPPAPPGDSSR